MMNVQTLSIVTGSTACQARCPFCVSKMTPTNGLDSKLPKINFRNFDKACALAKNWNVSTVILTGKGEPTLFPGQISDFLTLLEAYKFPLIELQTNGIAFEDNSLVPSLQYWYELGLTTVNISVVSHNATLNKQIYTPNRDYPRLDQTIEKLHNIGFSVRLSVTMLNGYVSNSLAVCNLIEFAKKHKVEQVTLRPVSTPKATENREVYEATKGLELWETQIQNVGNYLAENGNLLLKLPTGGCVYDIFGQNVCYTDCLTVHPDQGNFMRQLIYFPDGHLRYDWQYPGAIIF